MNQDNTVPLPPLPPFDNGVTYYQGTASLIGQRGYDAGIKAERERLVKEAGAMPKTTFAQTFANQTDEVFIAADVIEAIASLQAKLEAAEKDAARWHSNVDEICAMYRAPFSKETFAGLIDGMQRDLDAAIKESQK